MSKTIKIGDAVKVSKERMELGDDSLPSEAIVVGIDIHDIIFREGKSVKEISWEKAKQDRSIVITLDNEFEVYGNDIEPLTK